MAKYNIGGFTFTDEAEAKAAAKELRFEEAAYLRDRIKELEKKA